MGIVKGGVHNCVKFEDGILLKVSEVHLETIEE
jgi:hypothetical protein